MAAKVSGARHMAKAKAKVAKKSLGKLGNGKRAAALKKKGLSGALIGVIGRKKWGKSKMTKWSAAGRKRASKKGK